MRKILIGVGAAAILAAGGLFGYKFYVQYRVGREIEPAFAQVRAAGGQASHGRISFDPLSGDIEIADIAAEVATPVPVHMRIASVTVSGAKLADGARFSAETVETDGVELSLQMGGSISYKASSLVIKNLSGPAGPQPEENRQGADKGYRWALQRIATISSASITAPSLTVAIALPGSAVTLPVEHTYEYVYTNVALSDVRDGRIATSTVERAGITANIQQAGKPAKISGELAGIAAYDFDLTAALAILDPARANDDKYVRVYRQVVCGAYALSMPDGVRLRMEGFTADDVGLRPSRLQLPRLVAIASAAALSETTPTPAQTRDLMQEVAGIYEGIRIGNAETRGLAMEMPQGAMKVAAVRLNLENGKIGEFALEGLDMHSPQGPVKMGRFALRSIDLAGLLRWSAESIGQGQPPTPERALGLLQLLEGVDVRDFAGPYKNTSKQIKIDTFNLNWGQFVGPVPSKARWTVKMSAPLDANDPGQNMLVAAGLDTAAIDLDLGATWTEASHSFVLEPVALELGNIAKLAGRVSLANVPREIFSFNARQAAASVAQVEAGEIELTMHDLGGIDLLVAQYARAQNTSRDDARHAIAQRIRDISTTEAVKPVADAIKDALASFVETPGQTLTVKLTPPGKVTAAQLMPLLNSDPLAALAQFRVEASTGL